MKYSIIVIIDNKKNKIDKCLNSILNQTYINYEILVINSVKDYNISKLKEKYMLNYNNINFYNLQSKSVSQCRNFAIKNSKGKYLFYVNANDTLNNKNVLKKVNTFIDNKNIDILKCSTNCIEKYYNDRFSEIKFEETSGLDALNKFCLEDKIFANIFGFIFRREYLINNKMYFIDNTYHEDYGLIPIAIFRAKSVVSLDILMYNYSNIKSEYINIEKMNDFLLHTYNLLNFFNKNIQNNNIIIGYFNKRMKIKLSKLNNEDLNNINELLLEECNNLIKSKNDIISNKIDKVLNDYNYENFAIEYNISIKVIVKAAIKIFKSNLLSITIGGSAGKNKVIPDWSDLDMYFVLKNYEFIKVGLFDKLISKFNIHVGTTYYSIDEVESMCLDSKTKVMIYEKYNYNVNPTLYGKDYFKNVNYVDIRNSDINNLPSVLHEVRRMHVSAFNSRDNINKKYLKKLIVLIKCYLSIHYVFAYGYKNVVDEFFKIVNKKRKIANRIYFDIEDIIRNYKMKKSDVLEFGEIAICFIEKNLKEVN